MTRLLKLRSASRWGSDRLVDTGRGGNHAGGQDQADEGPIATLAMDGPRVAYASGKKVYVWNTVTGATTLLKGKYSSHTAEVAIAGTRVA